MPEKVRRFSHERLRDLQYDVFLHEDTPHNMLHVSINVDMHPDELHRVLLRELNYRRRFQIGAYRHIGTEAEHAYDVLFKEAVPHDPSEPYPLSRIFVEPLETGGSKVYVYGPKNVEHHVAYLLRTVARAVEQYRSS